MFPHEGVELSHFVRHLPIIAPGRAGYAEQRQRQHQRASCQRGKVLVFDGFHVRSSYAALDVGNQIPFSHLN